MKKSSENLTRLCTCCAEYVDLRKSFYTITKEPALEKKLKNSEGIKVMFFHPDCFKSIAGEQYV